MNNLVVLLTASLLFRTVSPSKNLKSSHGTKSTETGFEINSQVAAGLLEAFESEGSAVRSTANTYVEKSNILMPFEFPVFESYDMDLAERLNKRVGLAPPFIFSYLVQIIYKLVQFHVRRFFKLNPSEPLVPELPIPKPQEWYDSVQGWFRALFTAIMPGAVLCPHTQREPVKLERVYAKPFVFLTPGDNIFAYSKHVDGVPQLYMEQHMEEAPSVMVYALPSNLIGKTLEANQVTYIRLELNRSYPHCKKILEYLLQGVTFAFDLTSSNLEVIVKSTKNMPSAKKSMQALKELFEAPLERQIVVPEDVEEALRSRIVPKLSCYHPANRSLGSIELYERMMMLIAVGGAHRILKVDPRHPSISAMIVLEIWLKFYLPDASLTRSTGDLSDVQLYTYLPNPPRMWIYKGDMDGKEIGILLMFGKPVMLSLSQMVRLKHRTYPFAPEFLDIQSADTPIKKIIQVIRAELEKPMVVKSVKEPTLSMSKTELIAPRLDEDTVVEQLGALAFYLSASKETVDVALQAFLGSPLGQSTASFGAFRTAIMPLGMPSNPHHISFPMLHPMPKGKVFAVNLKTGKALRTKVPMMLHSTFKQDGKTYCRFIWFDMRVSGMTKSLPKTNGLFEIST